MSTLLNDLKQAFRSLANAPLFTLAAALTLALGIGVDSAMLAVFDRLLLRPLPFEDLETLVGVYEADTELGWTHNVVSAPNFVDFQREATQFEAMAAHRYASVSLSDGTEAHRVLAGRVSHEFFPILKVPMALGRSFTADEDRAGGHKAVILTHPIWQSRFGGEPALVGQSIRIDGLSHEVVGVLPAGFHIGGTLRGAIYLPMAFTTRELTDRARHAFGAVGRLRPEATVASADAELKQIAQELAVRYPESNEHGSATVSLLIDEVTQGRVPHAKLFISLASLLLVIACANVSNLILARGAARQRDLAIRSALGAGRGALARRTAAESFWLGLLGGAFSIVVALGLVKLMQYFFNNVPQIEDLTLDGRVLAIGFAVTLVAVFISGLVPTWRLSHVTLASLMNEGSHGSQGRHQSRFQAALLAVQVAMSVVLLTGAGLMVRTLIKVQDVTLGFATEDVLVVGVSLPPERYGSDEERQGFARRMRDHLGSLPQARGVTVSNSLPFWWRAGNWTYSVDGTPAGEQGVVEVSTVSQEFFSVMRVPLVGGRFLEDVDTDSCLVNQAFVLRHRLEGKALGAQVQLDPGQGPICTVVGVVGDTHNQDLLDKPPPQLFASIFHDTFQGNQGIFAYIQTEGDPALLVGQAKKAMRELDPHLAASPVRPLFEIIDRQLRRPRVVTTLCVAFAALGLVLAAVGLYGLVAFTVTQRTHEMGIRQALGARRDRLVRMLLGQSMRAVWWGLGLGVVACLPLGRSVASLLYGVTPTDVPTMVVVITLIVVVSLLSAMGPAIRAASVLPSEALRVE